MNTRFAVPVICLLLTAAAYAQDPAGSTFTSSADTRIETNVLQQTEENMLSADSTTVAAQQALIQNAHADQKIMHERAARTAYSVSSIVIGLIIVSIFLFPVLLLVIGIVVALATVKKEKREHTRISREAEKIDALAASGKITPEEARELKQALGPVAVADIPREPDTHIKVIGILNIVLPAVKILLFLFLFLGLTFFVAFERRAGHSGTHESPLFILATLVMLGVFFLALVIVRIISALALMKGRSWARVVIVVFGVLDLASMPLGTALGIYTLWALIFRENAGLYFISDNK